ncbi:tetratricopeptide repeat protein [Sphingomonas rhizophila]|uniref:Tetratricopeptide repeat protein n=1 Tax=Sphingomonas rhizophila TaxID=2071607 RepID=A0A7G9SDD8_9SPHN|nr:tetratricopeptide repeat protein [Sphingomonas rhizophila]QNN65863.1 tetratricopeptide repeat protein [Sphingomonas rhizophila]
MSFTANDPSLLYVRARTAEALGDTARSARLYASLSTINGNDWMLARRAVSSAIDAGSFDLAVLTARRIPADQLALDGRLLLIADSLRRSQLGEALTFVDDKTAEGDGGFVTPILRAWSEAAAGRDGLAPLSTQAVSQGLLEPFADEQRAFLLLSQRKASQAKPYIERALASSGGRETRLRLAFAEGLRRARDEAGAKALLVELAPEIRSKDVALDSPGIAISTPAEAVAELLAGIGGALTDNPDRSLPISLLRAAHHASPKSSEVAVLLALLLNRDGRNAEALAVLDPIDERDPFIGDVRDARLRLLLAANRNADAVAFARSTIASLGARARANDFGRLGDALRDAKDAAGAADAYGKAAALAGAAGQDNRWTYLMLRADQLESIGRWSEAKADLRAAIQIQPDQPLLLNFLGYGQLERGENLEEAEAMIRRALALRPDDASITDSLGWALFKRGRTDEAIETLRKAAAADPVQSEIHEHLGDALYTKGRRLEARYSWRAALITAEDQDAKRLQAKLDGGLSPETAAR